MKIRRQLLFIAALALLVLSAVALRQHFDKPQDHSLGELAAAQGQIISYSLLDDSPRHASIHDLPFSGYKATFQVPADFADYFAKKRFESDLKKGDTLSVSIPADSAGKLISGGTILVFAIRTTTSTYLDEHDTLAAYNNKNKPAQQVPSLDWLLYSCHRAGCLRSSPGRPRHRDFKTHPQTPGARAQAQRSF